VNAPRVAPQFRLVPLALVDDPALPSRTTMDEQQLDELVASIRAIGFISTIVLVPVGERYQVVAGHRRSKAARLAGLVDVPAFVYPSSSEALDAIQHAENRHREALSVTDEAIWFAQLLEAHAEEGTDGVAARVGESRTYVEGRLLLLRGCDRVFQALAEHKINIGVAQQLNRCDEDAHRFMLLDMAIRGGSTVGVVAQWVQEWKTIHQPASVNVPPFTPGAAGPAPIVNEYFRCRVCAENHNTANMLPVQIHDYCLQALIDPATGFFRSRADYVVFPSRREDAIALVHRLLERFPELAEENAARP
jgi:ParB/RepB/Spo0J family partition protein